MYDGLLLQQSFDQDPRVLLFVLEEIVFPRVLKPDRALLIHEHVHGDEGVIVAP